MLEYLEMYRPTPLESFVVEFYRKHAVRSPQDIDLEMFTWESGIWIHYASVPTTHYELDHSMYSIVIDDRMPWEQQRVELAHELGHCLLHAGNQALMINDFRVMQEWQADRFAMYALSPTFMIANTLIQASNRQQLVSQLAYQFDVTDPFMETRLKMLEARMRALAAQQQMATAIAKDRAQYDYSYRHPLNPSIEYLVKDNRVIHRRWRAAE